MKKSIKIFFWCLLLGMGANYGLYAQTVICSGSTPKYNIDMTGNPDSAWSSPAISRDGQCCGVSSSNNCIKFTITLDKDAQGFTVTIAGATGTTDYSVNCGTPTPVGDTICVSGVGPHEVTICKPGNNAQVYTIQSVSKPRLNDDTVLIASTCGKTLSVKGLTESSILWQSLTNDSTYNSYLSCRANCDTVTVSVPSSGYPAYVDYIVSGYNQDLTCDTNRLYDTVRVLMYGNPAVSIAQDTAYVCYGITTTNVTASPTGGLSPYQLLWSTNDTSTTVTLPLGTHWVRVTDSLGCVQGYDTVVVAQRPQILVSAGSDTAICSASNAVNLNGSVTNATGGVWTGRGGHFINDSTDLTTIYIPSYYEVAEGTTYLVLASTGNNGCDTTRDTIHITIYNAPVPEIVGDLKICEGTQNVSYEVTAQAGHSYDWHVVGGSIASGQGSNQIKVDWGSAGPGYMYIIQADSNGCEGVGAITTISRFDFNSHPLTRATIGPNATSYDSDAYSNGFGYQITSNCNSDKGIDLTIPGSVFDRGKICMTYSWQRDESVADFYTRGGITFRIRSGQLQIGLRIDNGSGGYTDLGPLNTGYTVPNDDEQRYFTFCYDSATGVGVAMQFDSVVWTYNGTPGRALYWTGAGDAVIGTVMDGSCQGKTLLDWSNISVPITIMSKPEAAISGPTSVCQYQTATYEITDTVNYYQYSWTVDGGTILSGQSTDSVIIQWDSLGTRQIQVSLYDTINGCDSTLQYTVVINAKPTPQITGADSVCQTVANTYTAPINSKYHYQWVAATGTITGATTSDSAVISFAQGGSHTIQLTITDTTTGCDSAITHTVFVDSLPAGNISGNTPVCEGSTLQIYQTASNGLYTYAWAVNSNGSITSGAATNSVTVDWNTSGIGTLSLTIEKAPLGCTTQIEYPVFINAKPVLGPIQHH